MNLKDTIGNAEWLESAATQAVFAAIAADGHRARVVGGAVRNTLMGRPVNDIDLATDAHPEDVSRLAREAGLSVHETGLQHGTVTVMSEGGPYEVTTLRTDVETDGRHATVAFTTDWAADASRRDFTINALYCDADGTIFDPLGGYDDVMAQRVRFIGDATARIREDYLRILRLFRFSAIFGNGELDANALTAVTAEQAGLDGISAERIRSELLKTLVGRHAVPIVEAMDKSGILQRVLACSPDFKTFGVLVEVERTCAIPGDAIRRLAALVGGSETQLREVARRLRLSNDEKAQLTVCADPQQLDLTSGRATRASLYRHGKSAIRSIALLQAAHRGNTACAATALSVAQDWLIPRFPVTGADLLDKGYASGPAVGECLRELERTWIDSDFTLTRCELLAGLD